MKNCLRVELVQLAIAMVLFMPHLGFSQTTSCDQSSIVPLGPCLPYVQTGNTTNPGSDCCSPLGSLLSSNPTCFCQLAPLAKNYNLSVNQSRALEVASLCKLVIPSSVYSCLAAVSPAGSPSGSITPPSSTPPATPGGSAPSAGNAVSPSSFVAGSAAAMALIYGLLSL